MLLTLIVFVLYLIILYLSRETIMQGVRWAGKLDNWIELLPYRIVKACVKVHCAQQRLVFDASTLWKIAII